MTLSEAKNTYNPPALYIAALNCLDLDRYWDSFELAMLARIYGLYDTKRVTDNSAHQAIIVLDMEFSNALRENEMLKFQGFSKEYAIGTPKGAEACKEWVKKGHPNYHPDYMIKHGMKATLDILAPPENGQGLKKEDEIVKDFNPDKSFADVLKNAHNCPA